jgi:hypothetical protein
MVSRRYRNAPKLHADLQKDFVETTNISRPCHRRAQIGRIDDVIHRDCQPHQFVGRLAQLVRARASHARGQWFESTSAHHLTHSTAWAYRRDGFSGVRRTPVSFATERPFLAPFPLLLLRLALFLEPLEGGVHPVALDVQVARCGAQLRVVEEPLDVGDDDGALGQRRVPQRLVSGGSIARNGNEFYPARNPTQGVLFQVVLDQFETFRRQAAGRGLFNGLFLS